MSDFRNDWISSEGGATSGRRSVFLDLGKMLKLSPWAHHGPTSKSSALLVRDAPDEVGYVLRSWWRSKSDHYICPIRLFLFEVFEREGGEWTNSIFYNDDCFEYLERPLYFVGEQLRWLFVFWTLLEVLDIVGFLRILGIILWKSDWREWVIVSSGIISWMLLQMFTCKTAF